MAAYSFEHINRNKGFEFTADKRNLLRGKPRFNPRWNNITDEVKSVEYRGNSFYDPLHRTFQQHDQKRSIPNLRVANQLEITSEDMWSKFQRNRDTHGSGMFQASSGFKNSSPPNLRLNGYAFNPNNLYRTGAPALTLYNPHNPWPKTQARPFPSWRGPGGYYGHYHEELDVHRTGGFRQLRSHRVLVNDDDIGKHEYMRAVPSLVDKLPVEFPVLH